MMLFKIVKVQFKIALYKKWMSVNEIMVSLECRYYHCFDYYWNEKYTVFKHLLTIVFFCILRNLFQYLMQHVPVHF
jgi:hypothetical protein